ncbi:MAG: CpsD/CapB family tyrosine-protein kinase [Oscillospiraceae bacterium]|nr:CpsD/CapB family tyrosine-protein kinase [Oscillospiraceae bacterium]
MKLRGNYEKAYAANDSKISKADKIHSLQERRKTIGKNLSFAAAEAYKLLRTNISLSMSDDAKCKIIGITSALRGECKSSTAINLAYTMAEANKKVLFIEADMRIPVAAKTLRINESPGLSNVLAGVNQLNEAVRPSVLLASLSVLPAGEIPPNPSELLFSARMEQLLKVLSEAFDYIIVDLPPVNAVSDSLTVSKLLSGMVMVVRQNYCDQHSLSEAMRQLDFLNVRLLGFVMNDAEPADKRYKKYGHKYQYKQEYEYRQSPANKTSADQADVSQKVGV